MSQKINYFQNSNGNIQKTKTHLLFLILNRMMLLNHSIIIIFKIEI